MRAKIRFNTPEEEAEIQRGIAQDPDAAELTDAELAEMRPAREMMPPALYAELVRRRGPGKSPAKVVLSLRVPPDVAAAVRAMGPGWQEAAGKALEDLARRSGRLP